MNAKDIRAEAEKRLAEIEAEAVELRKMLGKDPPAPQFVPYPAPVYVPTIQPYVQPYISPLPWPYDGIICTTPKTTSGTTITIGDVPAATSTFTLAGITFTEPMSISCSCPGGVHRTPFAEMSAASLAIEPNMSAVALSTISGTTFYG